MLITSTLISGCAKDDQSFAQSQTDVLFDSTNPASNNNSISDLPESTHSSFDTEDTSSDCIEVGDGIFRISDMPKSEKVTLSCEYGTALRYEGATAEAYGKTLDFSSIPDEYNNDYLPYCVCDEGETVYFADYKKFYKSDFDLISPTLLFAFDNDQSTQLSTISELISFSNTDLLFFRGYTDEGSCVGSINPDTCMTDFIMCPSSLKTVPCNAGVMLYDYGANSSGRSSTVLYWENGEIYEIPLQNPKESEVDVFVSANGKYICTYLWGKEKDNSLVERYSVYDIKSEEFVKNFDWTFNKKVGEQLPKGFSVLNIDETTKSVYLLNSEDSELYQFYFGG